MQSVRRPPRARREASGSSKRSSAARVAVAVTRRREVAATAAGSLALDYGRRRKRGGPCALKARRLKARRLVSISAELGARRRRRRRLRSRSSGRGAGARHPRRLKLAAMVVVPRVHDRVGGRRVVRERRWVDVAAAREVPHGAQDFARPRSRADRRRAVAESFHRRADNALSHGIFARRAARKRDGLAVGAQVGADHAGRGPFIVVHARVIDTALGLDTRRTIAPAVYPLHRGTIERFIRSLHSYVAQSQAQWCN